MENKFDIDELLSRIQPVEAPRFLWTRVETKIKLYEVPPISKAKVIATGLICIVLVILNIGILRKDVNSTTTSSEMAYPFQLHNSNELSYE